MKMALSVDTLVRARVANTLSNWAASQRNVIEANGIEVEALRSGVHLDSSGARRRFLDMLDSTHLLDQPTYDLSDIGKAPPDDALAASWSHLISSRLRLLASQSFLEEVKGEMERVSLEIKAQRLRDSFYSDFLTGLGNLGAFRDYLSERFKRTRDGMKKSDYKERKPQHGFSLAYIDLRGLKRINDSFGEEVGNEYLRAFADSLRKNLRDNDRVFRIGGDEFAVVFDGCLKQDAYNILLRAYGTISDEVNERVLKYLSSSYPNLSLDPVRFVAGVSDSSGVGSIEDLLEQTSITMAFAKSNSKKEGLRLNNPFLVEPEKCVLIYCPLLDGYYRRNMSYDGSRD